MPGMDGPTWVRNALQARPETRVIFMSGYPADIVAQRGLGLVWVPDGGVPTDRAATQAVLPDLVGAPCELRVAAPEALARTPRVKAYLDSVDALRALAIGG